jgi:hypothetical protein
MSAELYNAILWYLYGAEWQRKYERLRRRNGEIKEVTE